MRIQSIASFYDASSRINNINRVSRVEPEKTQEVKESNSPVKEESLQTNYSGVKQTLVSAENAYQKQMLSDPDFAMKRMAGKLMDKLPQIMEDMSKVSDSAVKNVPEISVANENVAPARIVIGENSNVDYSGNIATTLQDIKL